MEPNYSRHALIWAFCRSITRGVTLAFQSPNFCFEICDNQSRLPFVTACCVWCGGKKAWPIAMEEFPCFLFNSSKLSSPVPLPRCTQMITTERTRVCVCVGMRVGLLAVLAENAAGMCRTCERMHACVRHR